MSKKPGIPDAWDDDYESKVDQTTLSTNPASKKLLSSRAERKAQHAEANRQLWESAENPPTFHFIETRNAVPLKSDFKPQVQLLSRKPKPASTGDQNGSAAPQDDDSEEDRRREQELSLIEKQEKARREREEKQKRYAEVREKLFGSPGPAAELPSTARPSSPGGSRSRPIRGSRRGGGDLSGRASRSESSADQSPARGPAQSRELFDPDASTKSKSVLLARREHPGVADIMQPIRHPKGPDGSGRGGFGFAPRGNRSNVT